MHSVFFDAKLIDANMENKKRKQNSKEINLHKITDVPIIIIIIIF